MQYITAQELCEASMQLIQDAFNIQWPYGYFIDNFIQQVV